jgi:hypothetical protein
MTYNHLSQQTNGQLTTSHMKQRTNNDLKQQTIICLLWEVVIGPLLREVVIGPLFVVRGRYWSFVCCERSLLVLCLLWEVVIGPFLLWEVFIGPLFVARVRYWSFFVVRGCCWSFVYCERALLVLSLTINKGPIRTYHNKQRTNNNLSQQTHDQ